MLASLRLSISIMRERDKHLERSHGESTRARKIAKERDRTRGKLEVAK